MPAYLVARIQVHDPERYKDYASHTPEVIAAHGGTFLARGGAFRLKEGTDPDRNRVVVVEFASLAEAEAFYHSDAYQAILPTRQAAAISELFIVEGI